MMSSILVVARKELHSLFNSAVAYIVITLFLGILSLWFFSVHQFLARDVASLRGYFGLVPLLFVVLLPALTMRSWAEETRSGTQELLLTLPFSEAQLVAGKFLGALLLVALMLLLTLPVPLTVVPLGFFEIGEIAGQYAGTLLLATAGLAVGQFVSACSRNQISAFLLSALALLLFSLIHVVNAVVLLPRGMAGLVNHLSFSYHYQSFERGLIDTRGVAYYLLVTALFLYLNTKVLVLRKWR